MTLGLQGHAEERDGDLLPGREQDIELAGVGAWRQSSGEVDEAVGFAAHRRDHDHDLVFERAGRADLRGDPRMRSISPTDVPPNFCTMSVTAGGPPTVR